MHPEADGPDPSQVPGPDDGGQRRAIVAVIVGLAFLIIALAVVGGIIYVTDTPVQATVVDKECSNPILGGGMDSVTVQTKLFGIRHTLTDIRNDQCLLVQEDNFVEYRIRSERTSIWKDEGGLCIWDTLYGANGCPD